MIRFVPKFSDSSISSSTFNTASIFMTGLVLEALCGVIEDTRVNGSTVYVKGDFNYNQYCDILRQERVNQDYSDGSVKRYGSSRMNWLTTPWDSSNQQHVKY